MSGKERSRPRPSSRVLFEDADKAVIQVHGIGRVGVPICFLDFEH